MYRAIKKALPLSVCETDTTTVVEVDKGQRFITSVNYVPLYQLTTLIIMAAHPQIEPMRLILFTSWVTKLI